MHKGGRSAEPWDVYDLAEVDGFWKSGEFCIFKSNTKWLDPSTLKSRLFATPAASYFI